MRASERRSETNRAMDAVEGQGATEERAGEMESVWRVFCEDAPETEFGNQRKRCLAAKHTTGKSGMRVHEVHLGTAIGAHVALPLCAGEVAQVPPEINRLEGRIALGETLRYVLPGAALGGLL